MDYPLGALQSGERLARTRLNPYSNGLPSRGLQMSFSREEVYVS